MWVPMAHDEIATFYYYVQTARFIPFFSHEDMNNHVINSALTTMFTHIFGVSPLVLRLANLLFFPLFCIFIWKLATRFSMKLVRWWFIILLFLVQGFIEFFSLSRGYGMSMAMLVAMLFYLSRVTTSFSYPRLYFTFLWCFLSTLANLSLIYTFLLVIGWLFLLLFKQMKNYPFRTIIQNILLFSILSLLAVFLFMAISYKGTRMGPLFTGISAGFLPITLTSLMTIFLPVKIIFFRELLVFLFLLLAGFNLFLIMRRKTIFLQPVLSFYLLAGNLFAYWLANKLFQVNYPENRLAIYWLPLFVFALGQAIDDRLMFTGKKVWLVFLAPLLIFPALFPACINFSHAESYVDDPVPQSFYDRVKAAHLKGDYPPTVGGHRLRHFCWSFLDFMNGGTESNVNWEGYPNNIADFQIIDGKEINLFQRNYSVVGYYPHNDRYLLQRVKPVKKEILVSLPGSAPEIQTQGEYILLFQASVDTLSGSALYLGFEGDFLSSSIPFEAWIVAVVKDADQTALEYINMALNWQRPYWNESGSYLKNGFIIPALPHESKTLILYLWNMKSVPCSIKNFQCTLFRYLP